jgi:hypothetical protein
MSMPKRAGSPLLLLLPLLLTACATPSVPKLAPVGQVIPDGISLAGNWRLREAGDAPGMNATSVASNRGRRSRQDEDGPSVHVFLETGSRLKVTQTDYGLFISFDRSVVEEYRFREHRRVSVGPIDADRVSGWEDGRYVIQTLDVHGALLTETYALHDDGQQLLRTASIVYREQETLSLLQVFDRSK